MDNELPDISRPSQAETLDQTLWFEVEGYRTLRHAVWKPSGVTVLVGANGSGKSTLLSIPEFCGSLLKRGAAETAGRFGGAYGIRSWGQDSPASIRVHIGDLVWSFVLQEFNVGFKVEDQVQIDGTTLEIDSRVSFGGVGRRAAADSRLGRLNAEGHEKLSPYQTGLAALLNYCHHQNPHYWALRTQGSAQSADDRLHPSGQNAFAVLRNWAGARADRPRYAFVVDALSAAFPEVFADLSFPPGGNTVALNFVSTGSDQEVPSYLAPQGLLAALLHATAIASTDDGGIVGIDEFENGLHPYAIHALIEAFQDFATQHRLAIVLATHSPVVLNAFRDDPASVQVMDPTQPTQPTPLTDIHDPGWLKHFSLGDLYEHLEFAPQGKRP